MRKRDINMVEGALLPNIIRFAIPMIFTNVLQLAFNAVDLVVVGNFGLPNSVGAIGATGSITQLIVLFFSGLSVGVGVTIAQAIGAKDDQMVHRAVHTALPTAIPCGLFCTIIGLLFAEPLLTWLGTPADVLPYSVRYMRIIFCGVPFLLIYNFLAAVLNAAGDAKGPFVYLTTAGVVHLILNLFFGIVLKMDVTGAALATILSQALSAILVTIALMRRTDACRLVLSKMRIYAAPFKKILLFGVPTGLQNALFCISTTLIQSSVNSFGSAVMSGNSAAQSLDTFISTAINGFKFAAINFVSQNMGARQYGRVKKILGICIACGAVVGGLLGLLVWGFGPQLLSIYIPNAPKEAINAGMLRLTFMALFYFLYPLLDVPTGVLRGMGASTTSMLTSVLGICGFRVLWIYTVFAQFRSLEILYVSFPISWVLTGISQLIAIAVIYKRIVKTPAQNTLRM